MKSLNLHVLIFGSCVSRDIVAYGNQSSLPLQLVDYFARSSLATLGSPVLSESLPASLAKIPSKFQLRMVDRDMRKAFLTFLKQADFDVLLLDLIDERFDLWLGPNGEIYTLSSELTQTGFLAENTQGRVVKSGSDEFWHLWEAGWTRLIDHLRQSAQLDRLRINRVFWSKRRKNGHGFSGGHSEQRIERANEFLMRMYERMAQDVPGIQFFHFSPSELVAADEHKWGISPFHYVEGYYEIGVRQLMDLLPEPYSTQAQAALKTLSHDYSADAYDVAAWNADVYDYGSIASFSLRGNENGIHRVRVSRGHTIDLYVQDIQRIADSPVRTLLVCLCGAVSDRRNQKGPFFSGLSIARGLKLAICAIADPTLSQFGDLSLAWYAGNAQIPCLQKILALLLEKIAREQNVRLLIFGGSGGGFAALQLSTVLRCPASVLVWAPQTAIADYAPTFVQHYLECAFPGILGTDGKDPESLRRALEDTGVVHDVCCLPLPEHIELLYIQNLGD